ncbi:PAS domain S-box-containing protein/diguanylate cyclase (GGDEF) domain-containing protein [Sporobacter termitidis DSM 10068]|uniref:PAS domain S-box-containing protein/diguanylate cyclase (GGDEF) domain-containing protein n=1 Tax=Sporobacter termitidis DSM 10068 TaxID=1123282 RepID=A0A1M5WG45_9FIRM|nr:PAS domain S-box protein [Sporobacter termitidis]SHH86462.1 PAS domain S-box-containing protein/diguanylate cyclase (GGDEF) domain-containing protein [Sporobacter termitidis DSM 10068]
MTAEKAAPGKFVGISIGDFAGENYLRTILEATQDGFIVVAENERIMDANQAFFNMTGFTREDLKTLCLDDVIPKEIKADERRRADALMQNGFDLHEAKNRKKDGTVFDVEVSSAVLSLTPFTVVCFMRDITGRKNGENAILQSRDLMRYIIEHNRSAVAIHDKNLRYMYVSRPYLAAFRITEPDIIGRHHYDVFPNLSQKLRDVHARVLKGEVVTEDESLYTHADGASDWLRWECRPWYESGGAIGGLVLYSEIITERKRMEQALFNEKEHFKTALLSVGDGVISADSGGAVTVMNPIAERLTGWTAADALGKPLETVFRMRRENSGRVCGGYLKKVLKAGKIIELSNNILMVSKNGGEIPVEISAAPIRDRGGRTAGVVIVIRDFTEKRARQKQIEYLSFNDHLTGLYNRRFMEESIRKHDARKSLPLALMCIDVDGLKLTNDAFGHEVGDQLLKKVADLIKTVCRAGDIAGRMGGDEFCVLLRHTDARQAEAVRELLKTAAARLRLGPAIVSLAVGYAVKTSPEQDIKTIMTEADNLMYRDKIKHGRAMRSQTIETILRNINVNYEHEQVHVERVSHYCEAIAGAMRLGKKEIDDIRTVGALHDIGMIMVPPDILNKAGKLTKDEWAIIKRHPEIGYQMLKSVDEYAHLAEYVLYHHERWDGKGYPEGLAGEDIPLYSRIITAADAFEAMTARRPYRQTKTNAQAVAELWRNAGAQFDPDIVRVFVEKVLL